jgi:hypothetical protein
MVSKTERLEKELELAHAEDAYVAAKAAGQKKRDAALDKAFKAAKSRAEYDKARRDLPPAVSAEDKAEISAVRKDYRENYRGAPKGGGAAPATHAAGSQVN